MQVVADTFPAGTLSGHKHRNATNRRVRKTNRNFLWGAIGFMDLKATLITPL
jgi:hypothetical protein